MSIGVIFTTIMLGCVLILILGVAVFSFASRKMLDRYEKTKKEIEEEFNKEFRDWQ